MQAASHTRQEDKLEKRAEARSKFLDSLREHGGILRVPEVAEMLGVSIEAVMESDDIIFVYNDTAPGAPVLVIPGLQFKDEKLVPEFGRLAKAMEAKNFSITFMLSCLLACVLPSHPETELYKLLREGVSEDLYKQIEDFLVRGDIA